MESESGSDPPQPQLSQVTGVVIISLPPPDCPSKGKTITAFTLSDPPLHQPLPAARSPQPPPPPPAPRRRLRFPRRALVVLLGATFFFASLWLCLFSEAPLQLLRGAGEEGARRRDEPRSLVLPLYPKHGGRVLRDGGDVRLASRRITDGAEARRGRHQGSKLARSSPTNPSAVFHIGGNVFPDGQYYTTIFLGNPPRPYFLDVDTGSDLTWIQCDAPCTSCAQGPHPFYKPAKVNIVPPKDSLCLEVQSNQNYGYCESCQQCDYEIVYADHSSSMGVLARDEMHLIVASGDMIKLNFVFGCAYDQQGQLLASPAKTDGMLGLSSSKISFPSQLASQGIITNVMGHCITSKADGGGYLFLGDDFVPRWGMTWVPKRSGSTNFYCTEVAKINYGSQRLSMGGQESNILPVVFDTGSSYTYFTNEAYTMLIASLKSGLIDLVQDDSDPTLPICWRAKFPVRSLKEVKQYFEPLTLQFGKRWWVMSRSFTIPPEGYLIISDKGNVCLGILNGTGIHDGSTVILGDVSLRGKLVVYDNVQQKIGWVQSDCAKPHKPRGFPFFI